MAHSLVFKHIPSDDVNITPFQVFKKWDVTHGNFDNRFNIKIRRALLDNANYRIYDYAEGFDVTDKINPDGTNQYGLWYIINGLYYKEGKANLDLEYSDVMVRTLHETASYVQIPQQLFGEGIKLGSVEINNGGTVFLQDDGFGNLYDKALRTASMVPTEDLLGYWGFQDKFKYRGKRNPNPIIKTDINVLTTNQGLVQDGLGRNPLSYENIKFQPGLLTTGTQIAETGLKATFDGTSYLYLNKADDYNFKYDEDFAISLWTELPTSQSQVTGSYNHLVSKEGDVILQFQNKRKKTFGQYYESYSDIKYPYSIKVFNQSTSNNGLVEVSRNCVKKVPTITSTTKINDGQQHHICFNKTGSQLELWIDGVLEGSTPDTCEIIKENTNNNAILTFGSNGVFKGTGLSGSLDEIRIYAKGLRPDEVSSLSNMDYNTGSAYNTANVGNVFYPQGTIVISDPRPKYQNLLFGNNFDYTSSALDNFKLSFRATQTLYENEILCRVNDGEFNFTSNPTIRVYNSMESPLPKPFVTQSWHPYMTTIGLYDEYGRLLVVGKTAQPIPILDDVDTTFIVKWDY
jgi:hypothetical protein